MITKKEFKELCSFHVYTGGGNKHNVIYFDHKVVRDETAKADELFGKPLIGRGFKYGVALDIQEGTKADLIKHAYNWIVKEINLPYFVRYKYAIEDKNRFKVPLSLNW